MLDHVQLCSTSFLSYSVAVSLIAMGRIVTFTLRIPTLMILLRHRYRFSECVNDGGVLHAFVG